MGIISMIGGLTSLRLPETLHERLPQTLEEGENFGKEWSLENCVRCYSKQKTISHIESYEDLDLLQAKVLKEAKIQTGEEVGNTQPQGTSIKRLMRQMSVMDTQKKIDGTMQLTHWI
ncbi:PREDICTED: carcinine transporter-like [Rhagoletis zephyria]|nr:PREDICTED: carcinine transporter-like [Rhagoletis zephyria]